MIWDLVNISVKRVCDCGTTRSAISHRHLECLAVREVFLILVCGFLYFVKHMARIKNVAF